MSYDSPLARAIYTAPKQPEACGTCNKRGAFMSALNRGAIECSHIDCPNRKRCTAQPSARLPVDDTQGGAA